jgi:hypothetical protein
MNLTKTTKQLVATVALAGAVTAGTAGTAFAADSSAQSGSDPSAQVAHPRRAALRHRVAGIVSETLGVSRADLRAALKGGQSVREYAESLSKDPQTVVDALTSAANARIDTAVANGRISAERGETAKGKVAERVAKGMDRHFGQAQGS